MHLRPRQPQAPQLQAVRQIAQTADGAALAVQLPQKRQLSDSLQVGQAAVPQDQRFNAAGGQRLEIRRPKSGQGQLLEIGEVPQLRECLFRRTVQREFMHPREIRDMKRALRESGVSPCGAFHLVISA